MTRLATMAWIGLGVALAGLAAAHVRLTNPGNGAALRWSNPSSVSVVISSAGSDDVSDESDTAAVRLAVREWNQVTGTTAQLLENANPSARARLDWQSDDLHMAWFDEANSSEWFSTGAGVVAITPIWFNASGVITDADVIFNGRDWRFTTSGVAGRFDVQAVATHELGHLLGLDHSPHCAASMYPWVDPTIVTQRTVASDDVAGVRHAYPLGSWPSVTGRVLRVDGTPVQGAHIVARTSEGTPLATCLSTSDGSWSLRGLSAGTYTLYAAPLDGPVTASNLTTFGAVATDFGATMLGSVVVGVAGTTAVGDSTLAPDHGVSLGRASDDLPLRVVPGMARNATVRGSGLAPGSSLSTSNPHVTVSDVVWLHSQVRFVLSASAEAPWESLDLEVLTSTGERALATGVVEVTPANPVVTQVEPPVVTPTGGTAVLVRGAGFRAGVVAVMGAHIYAETDGLEVLDAQTLRIVTRPSNEGHVDVVVIDPSGIEGRMVEGLQVAAVPAIELVFPNAGSAEGGTVVHVTGVDFEAGSMVLIDGVVQDEIVQVDARTLRFRTRQGLAGAPAVLDVVSPTKGTASAAFLYTQGPDPLVASVSPPSGPAAGGGELEIVGENLPEVLEVVFGADPVTGLGGQSVTVSNRLDSRTLRVTVPPGAPGVIDLVVRDPAGLHVAVAGAAYTYLGPDSGPSTGCWLATRPLTPSSGLDAFLPVLLALAWLLQRGRLRSYDRSAEPASTRHCV